MGRRRVPLAERFWSKVDQSDVCWIWTGARTGGGYGAIAEGAPSRRMLLAHRVAYEWAKGPIPVGREIDHLCRNRRCVNPDHLEAVIHRENLRRADQSTGLRSARTHCPRGHPYDEENTYRAPSGRRLCRKCQRLAAETYRRQSRKGQPWDCAPDTESAKLAHYQALGRASVVARRAKYAAMSKPLCEVEGCDREARAFKGGPCNMHSLRMSRHGHY